MVIDLFCELNVTQLFPSCLLTIFHYRCLASCGRGLRFSAIFPFLFWG